MSILFVFCQFYFCHSFKRASSFKDKCNNNFNGHGEKEDHSEIKFGAQHDLNTAFDATEHVKRFD